MKKIFALTLAFSIGSFFIIYAQTPEEALRLGWNTPGGTARYRAIGGAMGSLGGDITAAYVNPAGIGLYKTREFVITPAFSFSNIKANFRGTDASAKKSAFDFGTIGFVTGKSIREGVWTGSAISFSINKTANFNNTVFYKGQNDLSSFSESFAEEFSNSGLPIGVNLYSAGLSLGTKLANYTYLIDTLTINGNTEVIGLPQRNSILAGTGAVVNQEKRIETKGGISELNIGYAMTKLDKLYVGISFGIPFVNYQRFSTITETDATGSSTNNFNYARYDEDYQLKGIGVNLKLGVIIKPVEYLRLGFAMHTPSLINPLTQTQTGAIEADLENYFPPGKNMRKANQDTIYTQFGQGVPEYVMYHFSPWKFLLSASYVIREVEDITKQRGFITADVEYATYNSTRFNADDPVDQSYYDGVNEATRLLYKGAFNFRMGGELKFNTIMTRLGFGYYGNPYKDETLDARRMTLSGGLGYRNKGYFIDLTYVHYLNDDVNFPYRLGDKPNTYAILKENMGNLVLSVGMKF